MHQENFLKVYGQQVVQSQPTDQNSISIREFFQDSQVASWFIIMALIIGFGNMLYAIIEFLRTA
jgi:hypothetical protein